MSLDPEIFKKLIETFNSELNDQLQVITLDLIQLKQVELNTPQYGEIIQEIFRSAHNIKGTSRSLGINTIGEIAHAIESLFAAIQKNEKKLSNDILSLCLEATDKIRAAMQSYLANSALPFDLDSFLKKLKNEPDNDTDKVQEQVSVPEQANKQTINASDWRPKTGVYNESVRVSITQVDRVAALLEEMQTNKIGIEDHYIELVNANNKVKEFDNYWEKFLSQFKDKNINPHIINARDCFNEILNSMDHLNKALKSSTHELDSLSNNLQEEVRLMRLIPASTLLQNIPRYVYELAQSLNKNVELKIQGDEVKMDRMVLDSLNDPIIHLLRNAVDHGIEDIEMRKKAGKSETGHINVELKEEGDEILIRISDDGAGLNIQKIKDTALKNKIIPSSELEKMSDESVIDLIFRPGFSTRDVVTDVSGRGVGLDVVKVNLNPLKGSVTVNSKPNSGTTFTLRVPLTLASERGLVVKCASEVFVIPSSSVEHILMIEPADVILVENNQAILVDGHPISLFFLSSVLHLANKNIEFKSAGLPVVIVKKGIQLIAFLVDEILGERDIVLKPLQPPLGNIRCVAGGTLSASSQVIIVLNAIELVNEALNIVDQPTPITFKMNKESIPIKPHILVVDDSITTRTLEKNILESKNYQVTVAVNGKDAWDLLQNQKFSLMITDISMPIMDGFTLTSQVKQSDKLHDLPVIIVTSLGSEAEKKRGLDAGADAYIIKNEFESGLLLDVVAQLV